MIRVLAYTVVVPLLCAPLLSTSFAGEPVSIGAIYNDVEAYQARDVTMQGTVHQIHRLPPFREQGGPLLTPCSFVLDDGTGAIEVHVDRHCPLAELEVAASNGGRVEVEARIQAASSLGTYLRIEAIAGTIRRHAEK